MRPISRITDNRCRWQKTGLLQGVTPPVLCYGLFVRIIIVLLGFLALSSGCTEVQCQFHSQCGAGYYCIGGLCRQDCRLDTDCPDGLSCNSIGECVMGTDGGGPSTPDATTPPPPPPPDTGTPDAGIPDARPPTPDATIMGGHGAYLDRCTTVGDCSAGLGCVRDSGGTSFCSLPCTGHTGCAQGHVCAEDGFCHPNDTGSPCASSASEACVLGLCLAFSSTGAGSCTRDCTSAADCPAGYACTDAGGMHVCVDIEHGCSAASDCLTGSCLPTQGCTATCRTAADCPSRFSFLPAYTCEVAFGSTSPICVPPSDILGANPVGAACTGTGTTTCRSGACNTSETSGPMCTQTCNSRGGCGPGLGCFPQVEGGSIELLCVRAGSRDLLQPCTRASDCGSGLCDGTTSQCTRLCSDGICPTGWSCVPVAGFPLAICRRS